MISFFLETKWEKRQHRLYKEFLKFAPKTQTVQVRPSALNQDCSKTQLTFSLAKGYTWKVRLLGVAL